MRRASAQLACILAVCAVLFLPRLGSSGLAMTEGHRAIPGWTMLETGDWSRIELYGASYVRKPPGMPWAVAAGGRALGPSPFSARLVSVVAITLVCVTSWWFGRRWFAPGPGQPGGVSAAMAAGLAPALLPLLWPVARAAEIEALLLFGVQWACLPVIHLLAPAGIGPTTVRARLCMVSMLVIGVVVSIISKGPAGLAPIGATIVLAAALGWRGGRRRVVISTVSVAAACAAGVLVAWWLLRPFLDQRAEPDAIGESIGHFLWNRDAVVGVALLPLAAFIAALPASFAVLFPWGPDARRESADDPALARLTCARILAGAWIVSVLALCVYGVSNPRYAMPGAGLLGPLAGYVVAGWVRGFTPGRRRIASVCMLGRPVVMAAVLVAAGIGFTQWSESRRASISGEPVGRAVAEAVRDHPGARPVGDMELVADALIEARPEVLLALHRSGVRVRWTPGLAEAESLTPGMLVALRCDAGAPGEAQLARELEQADHSLVAGGRVHNYAFQIFLIAPKARAPLPVDE